MSVAYEPPSSANEPAPREGGRGGGGPEAPAPGAPGASGGPGVVGGVGTQQSGGSIDVVGSIPALNVPQGQGVLIREGGMQFRFILDRFEGVDTKRAATEIGELQAGNLKNAFTDEQ